MVRPRRDSKVIPADPFRLLIPQRRLTVERLADAMCIAASDRALRERTQQLARRIDAEDGAALALLLHQSA
jgi:hypothetical protein